jgi:hypothetical protein
MCCAEHAHTTGMAKSCESTHVCHQDCCTISEALVLTALHNPGPSCAELLVSGTQAVWYGQSDVSSALLWPCSDGCLVAGAARGMHVHHKDYVQALHSMASMSLCQAYIHKQGRVLKRAALRPTCSSTQFRQQCYAQSNGTHAHKKLPPGAHQVLQLQAGVQARVGTSACV